MNLNYSGCFSRFAFQKRSLFAIATGVYCFLILGLFPPKLFARPADLAELYKSIEIADFRIDGILNLSFSDLQPFLKTASDEAQLKPLVSDKVSLRALWAIAFALNPDLEAARHMIRARAEMYPQTMYVDALAAEYRSFVQNISTRTSGGNMPGGLELLFPGPGVISFNGRLARIEVEMACEQYAATLVNIGADILSAAAEREALRKSIAVMNEMLTILLAFEKSLKSRFVTNQAMYSQFSRLQAEISRIKNERDTLKRSFDATLPRLNQLLGRPYSAPLGRVLFPELAHPIEETKLINCALAHNQNLRIQKLDISILKTLSSLKRRTTLSPLSPGFAYPKSAMMNSAMTTSSMNMNKVSKDPLQSYRQSFTTMPIEARIPNFGGPVAYLRELDRRVEAETARLSEIENNLRSEIAETLSEFTNAQNSGKTEKNLVYPALKRGVDSASSGYQGGTGSFVEWMDLFLETLDSRMAEIRYLMAAQKNLARIYKLKGTFEDNEKSNRSVGIF